MGEIKKIGLGGGCHWCTEAVFQHIKGVITVEQGFISATGNAASPSEAVIITYDAAKISLKILIEIHLLTHNSTSNHSFREKYRSAIYYFEQASRQASEKILQELQQDFEEEIITKILPFKTFKPSEERFRNYYQQDPNRPFCQRFIHPKLKMLQQKFKKEVREINS